MKQLTASFQITAIVLLFLFTSCKKEDKDTPLSAASLAGGKAGIRFTTSESFKNNKSFDVSNTVSTSAITKPASGNTTIRNIILEATDMKDNTPNRMVRIDMVVPNTANTTIGNITINLSVQSGAPPLAFIRLESYSMFLGATWTTTSGTMTITKLTATEVEGTFSGTASVYPPGSSTIHVPLTISNGSFAGKF